VETEAKRVRKAPEIRFGEILDCARHLFFSRGNENTTVNDIIDAAGVSKGAFYHYFESKDALLEALADRLADESLATLQPIFDDPSLDAVSRFNALFAGARQYKAENAAELRRTFDVIFRPENLVLFHRIDQALTEKTAPLFAQIIEQGLREGSMDATDPLATAEMILHLRLAMGRFMDRAIRLAEQGELEAAIAMLDKRIRLYGLAVDRVLKLPDGTLNVAGPAFARAFLEVAPGA
jgi:AcrR family transcriptional regulator